ncbi:CRISPR-associated protein Cas4 [Hyperthermus butylicus]|uniref:CRISPR-associated exonuclease Cas4 n=1 Tax=Hyperthermus butylicus (strain DSM 5456 / JCM 9403 / PLM1-5) TaxID=415426 RepID=A2BKJ5_HYPBU|nr:CRISPR-associated protein Cas4 [Hyperthermus butylicus]ABM80506.1 putative RecB nuclease [Hyperthermus butylicus DSM 5456]
MEAQRLIPIVLVKEYYWCPVAAWHKLVLWAERPTFSMEAGGLSGETRWRLLERLEEVFARWRVEARELLWEHPVTSSRLGLAGRVDLAAVLSDDTLVVVEAKLSLPGKRRSLHIRVQAAAYGMAAEETLGYPLRMALIYEAERNRIVEVEVTPMLRKMVEDAARELHEMLQRGEPLQHYTVSPRRCRVCSYRGVCTYART